MSKTDSVDIPPESENLSEEERDVFSNRKSQKTKQKRRASTIAVKEHGKLKSSSLTRASKNRQSLSQISEELNEALRLVKTRSNQVNLLSTFDESHEDEDNNRNTTDFHRLTINETDIQRRYSSGEASSFSEEGDMRNTQLEDRLENDNELDVTGIMNLASMNIVDDDLPAIMQRAFSGDRKKCTGLILRDNALTSEGVRMIVDAVLSTRAMLKYLSFSNNPNIKDEGIEHLGRLLQKSKHIKFLSVPNTNMTDRSVRLLADVLCGVDAESTIPSLEKLYISFNKSITDESLEPILQILEHNQTLKVLSIEHCSFSETARKSLRNFISKAKKKKFSLTE